MNNGDKPANSFMIMESDEHGNIDYYKELGLTKREEFAARAMQGLLSNVDFNRADYERIDNISRISIMQADSLLKELEK